MVNLGEPVNQELLAEVLSGPWYRFRSRNVEIVKKRLIEGLSLKDLAHEYDVCEQRIRQIVGKAERQLRIANIRGQRLVSPE